MNLFPKASSVLFVPVLAIVTTACGTSPTDPGLTQFEDVTWKLQSVDYTNGDAVNIEDPDAFTALFASDERLHIQADCNVCNGSYGAEGGALSVSPLACTRAFCFSAPLDTDYVSLLQSATTIAATDDELLLRGPLGSLSFRR